jgi:hypothetical protein
MKSPKKQSALRPLWINFVFFVVKKTSNYKVLKHSPKKKTYLYFSAVNSQIFTTVLVANSIASAATNS